MSHKIAFLVYKPYRKRRSNNSFQGNGNIGALVIESALRDNNIKVGRCTPESAHKYDLVLVSFTSSYDILSFYQQVAMRREWQADKRAFKVLGGGFGVQNPTLVRDYIDYAAFGRAENWVYPVVDTILGGGIPNHPSLMNLPEIHPVTISQSDKLIFTDQYKESFTGCPHKCMFCHYTWARKYRDERGGNKGSYVQESLTGGNSPELTWDQLFTYNKKAGRVRVAVDGFSERLRYIYGKRISNSDIVYGINAIGKYDGNTVLLVYNICNMPTETGRDIKEMYNTLDIANPKGRVIFVLHSTPFRPSLATPMQWEKVTLWPEWVEKRSEVIHDKPNFRAVHSFTLESAWSHLTTAIIERATPDSREMFHNIAFSPTFTNNKWKSAKKVKILQSNFDISPYIREYHLDERHPGWFLSSYTSEDKLKRIAKVIRAKALDRNYSPRGKSLVQIRLNLDHTGEQPTLC